MNDLGQEVLRAALRRARLAFISDEAYKQAEEREWLRRSDETCRAIARLAFREVDAKAPR
jgi:hypothetical protein